MYQYDPLTALGRKLAVRGLTVTDTTDRLHVEDATGISVTITCRPREEDGGRLWFFTGDGEPISETGGGHERDAVLYILGHLARRAERRADEATR